VPTLQVNQQAADSPKKIEHWGLVEDPATGSQIESDGKTLTITAPDDYVDNYPKGKVNAPRVLQEVSGDFTAQVDITELDEAKPDSVHKSLGTFPTAYHAGTLLLRHDNSNFVRFERVNANSGGESASTCVIQVWKEKNLVFYRVMPIEDKPIRLKLERRGTKLTASFSQNQGDSWTKFPEHTLEGFPGEAKVGVSITSNTEKGCKVKFEKFQLETTKE